MAKRKTTATVNRIEQLDAENQNGETDFNAPAAMDLQILVFDIVGISPLLQNNPSEFIEKVEDSAIASSKKVYDDKEEASLRVYKDPDGNFVHPANAFPKAMLNAVKGKKFGKQFATTLIKGAVFVAEPWIPILDKNGKRAKKYEIDRQPVVIGKARILRCRPCWYDWRMKLPLEVDVAILSRSQVAEALSLAGRIIGIGDYRPENGGGYGRFRVE